MEREPIFPRLASLITMRCLTMMSCGISDPFGPLSPAGRYVVHVLLTRLPLYSLPCGNFLARLACVRHAASVRPEPGSNSLDKLAITLFPRILQTLEG